MQRTPAPREPLNWDDLRLFLALARATRVGDAAAALRVDASTVSRRLAALERSLAVVLFDRGRAGISPTKVGEDLIPVAEEMEMVMARFASAADSLERDASGNVRIACPPDVADIVLAPLVSELLERHPALRVEIVPGEAVLDLTRREADVALRVVRPTRGDLVFTKLTTMRWILAAAPELAKRIGPLKAWTDAPWIGWGQSLSGIAPARWVATHVREVDPVVRSDSLLVQLAVLATGTGVGLVPEPSMSHYGLVPVRVAAPLREEAALWPSNDLFLVTHRALREVPRIKAVWELLARRVPERHRPKKAHAG
jgi:DNA-binding transcriptional LysR family regulator